MVYTEVGVGKVSMDELTGGRIEIPVSRGSKKIVLKAFDEELKRLCAVHSTTKDAIAEKIGTNYVTMWRILVGRIHPKRKLLVKLAANYKAFDLVKWLLYFGYLPDRVFDMARINPDMAYNIFLKVFYPDKLAAQQDKEKVQTAEDLKVLESIFPDDFDEDVSEVTSLDDAES